MSRLSVRADSQSHEENGDHDIVEALQNILKGKKPVAGKARHNRLGQAFGNRMQEQAHVGQQAGHAEGLRVAEV